MSIHYIVKNNNIIYFHGNATENYFKDKKFKISVKSVAIMEE